ncbi:MAG: hypothetical protein KDA32_00725 [Phycisphaerales bacterium]|nr:hypothetical protein [Phycisphaerales bacterium]
MVRSLTMIALLGGCAGIAVADCPESWSVTISTTGGTVSWMSLTNVATNGDEYEVSLLVTDVRADVVWGSFTIPNVSVIDQLDANQLTQSAIAQGPLPVVASSQDVVVPPPPAAPSISGSVTVGLDANGFAVVSATNVTLGTAQVVLPVFGLQTVTLTRIELQGIVSVSPSLNADLNGDGTVALEDLAALLASFSLCGSDVPDLNGDGCTALEDLAGLLADFGASVCP